MKVVFIFSSKTRVLVWCGLKQAEYQPNMTHVSEQCLSLAEYPRIRKRAFSAGFQTENDRFKNPSTDKVLLIVNFFLCIYISKKIEKYSASASRTKHFT